MCLFWELTWIDSTEKIPVCTIASTVRVTTSKSKIQSYTDPFLFIFKISAVWELTLSIFRMCFYLVRFIFAANPTIITSPVLEWLLFLLPWRNSPWWARASSGHHDHTQTLHTLDGRSQRYLYLTTHNARYRQTSIFPAGFEPTIPASDRPQTHSLDRAATWLHCHW